MKGRTYKTMILAAALLAAVQMAGCGANTVENEIGTTESQEALEIGETTAGESETTEGTAGTAAEQSEKKTANKAADGAVTGTVIGTLEELTAGQITILSDNGNGWTFDTTEAAISLPSGARIGNLVAIDYSGTLSEGENQRADALRIVGSYDVDEQEESAEETLTAEGTLKELTMNTITLTQADGTEVTFSTIYVPLSFESGLSADMPIKVVYSGTFEGSDATGKNVNVMQISGN